MKKQFFFFMGMLCALVTCRGQTPPSRALTIGDTTVSVVFDHMLNYKDTRANLSDFCGKPLILDLFSTWCSACIGALPKLDSLQRAFGDSLQILVIDYEPTDRVKKFLKNNPVGQAVSLPFVTGDSLVSYVMFPHRSIPQEIWIDANGVIRAITTADYINAINLRNLVLKNPIDLPLKNDLMHFDNRKPLFVDGNGGDASQIQFRSTLSGHIDGIGAKIGHQKDSLSRRLYEFNRSVLALYDVAAQGIGNRLILDVKDNSHYINDGSLNPDQWARKNDYSYELIAPVNTPDSLMYRWMLLDLNRWLNLNGHWEARRISCWALVINNNGSTAFKTKGGKPQLKYGPELTTKIFINQSVATLVRALNYYSFGNPLIPIVINETGYRGNVDLKLKIANIHDMAALRKALQSYGLDLIAVQRELKMFVLTENKNKGSFGQGPLGID